MVELNFTQQKLFNLIVNTHFENKKQLTLEESKFVLNEFLFNYRTYLKGKHKKQSYYKVFKGFVEYVLARHLANFNCMILLSGEQGVGKSVTAIAMARQWCSLLGKRFDPKRHIAYNNNEMIERIKNLDPFEPLIADESIRFASSADWNKSENKELKTLLGQVRTKHLFFVLCFPLKLNKLDKTYLDSYVSYWVHMFKRGGGAIFIPDLSMSDERWNLKAFQKLGSFNEFTTPAIIQQSLEKHPNFWKFMKTPNIPKKVYERYLKIRDGNVFNDKNAIGTITELDKNTSILIVALQLLMAQDSTMSMKRLILFIEQELDIKLKSKDINEVMTRARMMVDAVLGKKMESSNDDEDFVDDCDILEDED